MHRDAQDALDALEHPAAWKNGRRFQSAEGQQGLAAYLQRNAGPPSRVRPVPAVDDPLTVTIRAAMNANREGDR